MRDILVSKFFSDILSEFLLKFLALDRYKVWDKFSRTMTIKFFIPPQFCFVSPSTAIPWLFFVHFTVFQHLLQHPDRVAGLCPNFLAPAVSACIRAGDLRSLFAPGSDRNCCVITCLHFAPGQSSHPFNNCCDGVSKRQ